jgi:predicted component of type VI protein secretion system
MAITLIVMGGAHQGRRIPITVSRFLIGRDPLCNLRPASKEVQWEHCAILPKEEGAVLRDYTSGCGTYLNGRLLVGGEMQLEDGDVITVGPLSFQVSLTADSTGVLPGRGEPELLREVANDAPSSETVVEAKRPEKPAPVRRAYPRSTIKPMKDSREILCGM